MPRLVFVSHTQHIHVVAASFGSAVLMPGLMGGTCLLYLVVAAQPHEKNHCLDVVEAVHPFSPLAALSPDVYKGIPVFSFHDVMNEQADAMARICQRGADMVGFTCQ